MSHRQPQQQRPHPSDVARDTVVPEVPAASPSTRPRTPPTTATVTQRLVPQRHTTVTGVRDYDFPEDASPSSEQRAMQVVHTDNDDEVTPSTPPLLLLLSRSV